MGNKIKKLVCALLASAMLVSSFGVIGFADADKDEANADSEITTTAAPEATETPDATEAPAATPEATPEATAAPEATQAPEESGSAYDKDNYYQKSLALCSSLGIISGYEDGSVKPDSNVTRAEMASIVLRMLAISTHSKYQNVFKDVDASHWAADQIQTAMEQSIISGMGDGTFVPDGEVTYAQVLVMLVNALNYSYEAEQYGGWPNGYLQEAEQLGLTKNVKGVIDVPSTRGEVIKMVYNSLLTDFRDIAGYEGGSPIYKSEKTLAEAKFDVLEAKGTLWATNKTTLTDSKMQENQIQIEKDKADANEDKTRVYECALTGLEDYLAQNITFYYRENKGLMPEVLAVSNNASKSDSYVIDDITDIEKVTGFDTSHGSIKVDGVSKAKDCTDAKLIYNGKLLTAKMYDDLKADAVEKERPFFKNDINDLIGNAEVGSVRLVDSDKDGVYDVVFVDSYVTMVVSSASAERLNGDIADTSEGATVGDTVSIGFNFDDTEDRTITVKKGDSEARIRNLKKDDVASLKISLDYTVVDIVVTGESITGSASGVSTKFGESKATINGTKYSIADVAAGDLKAGVQAVFYLDKFGRVGRIEASASGQLQSGEKYGWLMNAYDSNNGEDYILKVMTTDGKAVEYTASEKSIDFWGPSDKASHSVSASELKKTLSDMIKNDGFMSADSYQIRLIKYKTNSSGNITRLYCAIDEKQNRDADGALKMNPTNLRGRAITAGLVSGYKIEDGGLEFSVPSKASNMKNETDYKIGTVTASVYAVRENGSSRNFIVGECGDSSIPTVFINFVESTDEDAKISDMDTNANNPTMVVTSVDSSIDDDDNPVYVINGYSGNQEVSVTTTKNAVFAKCIGMKYSENSYGVIAGNPRVYQTTTPGDALWKAQDPKGKSLADFIGEGDVVLCDGGSRILQIVDADDVYEQVVNGTDNNDGDSGLTIGRGYDSFNTRNMYSFGHVNDMEITSDAVLKLDTVNRKGDAVLDTMAFDLSKILDTVDITVMSDGKYDIKVDEEGSEAYDIEEFDASVKKGDIALARFADKGTLQEIVIYRFK